MSEDASPLVPPTQEQQQAIMRLTEAVNRALVGEDGQIVMSALASIIVSFAANEPPHIRAEIRSDVAYLKAMVDAMGDAPTREAFELANEIQPGQCFEGCAPLGDGATTRH